MRLLKKFNADRMDASAYLKRHGWRGDGHSLDLTDRGIQKPLLISKKIDVLGLGINKHAAVSDQWWMRAFDQGLKNLGTGKESTLASVRKHGVHHGGLYGRFVKGEGVPGTIGTKGWISYAEAERQAIIPLDDGNDVEKSCQNKKRKRDGEINGQKVKRKRQRSESCADEALGVSKSTGTAQPRAQKDSGEDAKGSRRRKLSKAKLAGYQKRADEKGMTVDEYIKRREKKYAARKGSKSDQPP